MRQSLASRMGMLLVIYTLGSVLFILITLLKVFCRLRIVSVAGHYPKRNIVLYANHPSLIEPVLLPIVVFGRDIFFHPFKTIPWSVADKQNYYDKWYYFWLRACRIIPVRRNKAGERSDIQALRHMVAAVKSGYNIMIFPEGTRTAKTKQRRSGAYGRQIGIFRRGIELLVHCGNVQFLPVWIEGTDKILPVGSFFLRFWRSRITVVIGSSVCPREMNCSQQQEIKTILEDHLLKLTAEIPPA